MANTSHSSTVILSSIPTAPSDGIVIGRSTNPVSVTGARIIHLGIIGEEENFATPSEDEEHYIDGLES